MPREAAVPPAGVAKNWTLTIVPSASVAVAETALVEPTPTEAASAGAVTATAGSWLAATVMLTEALVA